MAHETEYHGRSLNLSQSFFGDNDSRLDEDRRTSQELPRLGLSPQHSTRAINQTVTVKSAPLVESHESLTLWPGYTAGVTLLLCASLGIVVKVYSVKTGMPNGTKHGFETITTALLIFLGLNFNEAFKALPKTSRQKILELRSWKAEDEAFLQQIISFKAVIKNVIRSRASWWIRLGGLIWILFGLAAQVVIALISLTYSTQGASDYNGTFTAPGNVSASSLTCYNANYNPQIGCSLWDPEIAASLANNYGRAGDAYSSCPYDDISEVVTSPVNCPKYHARQEHSMQNAYRFKEYNPNDTARAYPRFTNRVITVSSAPCRVYNQTTRDIEKDRTFVLGYSNGTYNSSIRIPGEYITDSSTQYIYRDSNPPPKAKDYACGPRCIIVWAHVTGGQGQAPIFYECDITVSEVSNMTDPHTQAVPNDVARLAAASIALSGRRADGGGGPGGPWQQYTLSTFGASRELHYTSSDHAGSIMASFAMGSLAFMIDRNPTLHVRGQVPYLGSSLSVHWRYLIVILVVVSLTHLAIWILCEWLQRDVEGTGGRRVFGDSPGHRLWAGGASPPDGKRSQRGRWERIGGRRRDQEGIEMNDGHGHVS